ncbi:MAG: hypothetical protein ACT4N2_12775 [Hyphomicrobium sp.]
MPWWFDLLTFAPILIVLAVSIYFLRHGFWGLGFIRKQSDYLDHQKSVNERALQQNKSIEDLIAQQYRETNERDDRALSMSEEAIRLHAAALEQLASMNRTLARLAELRDTPSDSTQPPTPAS